MAANSNAIATVTIQDQDLLGAGFAVLAQRMAAAVTFPSGNAIQFSGYQVVSSVSFANLFPASTSVSFVYIRNATQSGQNALALTLQPTGGASTGINLSPGGIFLWANSAVFTGGATPNNSWIQVQYAAFVSAPVVMEYMFAF